jgi:hypothetical protein
MKKIISVPLMLCPRISSDLIYSEFVVKNMAAPCYLLPSLYAAAFVRRTTSSTDLHPYEILGQSISGTEIIFFYRIMWLTLLIFYFNVLVISWYWMTRKYEKSTGDRASQTEQISARWANWYSRAPWASNFRFFQPVDFSYFRVIQYRLITRTLK